MHPDFKNNGDKVDFGYPLVLVTSKPIDSISSIMPALELAKKARKSLAIFTSNIREGPLSTIIYNKKKGIVSACVFKIPDYGSKGKSLMKDIADLTGAYHYDSTGESELRNIDYSHFGKSIKILSEEFETTVLGFSRN